MRESDFEVYARNVERAAQVLIDGTTREMELQALRAEVKEAAILRLMEKPNPLTSTPEKPKLHAGTSAEAVVETDAEYADHLRQQRNIVAVKLGAEARYEVAKARLWLAARLAADTQTEALR